MVFSTLKLPIKFISYHFNCVKINRLNFKYFCLATFTRFIKYLYQTKYLIFSFQTFKIIFSKFYYLYFAIIFLYETQ